MHKPRRVTTDHKVEKLIRKVRLSVSLDRDALKLLERMANDERRSVSSTLNLLLYDTAEAKGLYSPPPLPMKADGGPS